MTKLFLIPLALGAAMPALAAEPLPVESRTVITADLDLTTANGREALDRRLVRAAADVCGAAAQVDLDGRNAVRACRVEVLAGARLAADRQVALHSVGAPIELAAR